MLWICTPALAALVATYAVTRQLGISFSHLTRDPAGAFDIPVYAGLFSHLGVFIVAGSGAAAALIGLALPNWRSRISSRMLLWAGIGSVMAAADDLFLLHELVLPTLGIPEPVTVSLYPLAAALYLWRFGLLIARQESLGLVAGAVGLLGLSVMADVGLIPFPLALLEDPAKLLGFVLWALFLVRSARLSVRSVVRVPAEL
jgi:hypothetical protein